MVRLEAEGAGGGVQSCTRAVGAELASTELATSGRVSRTTGYGRGGV